MEREFNYDIMDEIKRRWSSRSFISDPVASLQVNALFEAARYAPSCFNGQPWRFLIGSNESERKTLASFLTEGNSWALKAPVLVLVIGKRNFEQVDKPNKWFQFDVGLATGFLLLEGQRQGLAVHPMAGFNANKAREVLGIPEEYEPIVMLAIGKRGIVSNLPTEELQQREKPGVRRSLEEFVISLDQVKAL